jgi:hypothetical protein
VKDATAFYCRATAQPVPATEGAFVRCALESLALFIPEGWPTIAKRLNVGSRRTKQTPSPEGTVEAGWCALIFSVDVAGLSRPFGTGHCISHVTQR